MLEQLDIYWRLLGQHAEKLEEQVEPLAQEMLHRDHDWYRHQRSRHGDPFAELEQIVKGAGKRQLKYASLRVALAAVNEKLAAEKGIEPPAPKLEAAEEMLDAYGRKFGPQDAKVIKSLASRYRPLVKPEPDWIKERARRFADPYPPRSELDDKISNWVRKNRGPATALFALDRAERRTALERAEFERAEFEVAEGEPAVAKEEPTEPRLEEGAIEWLSGPEVNQRIEQRKRELEPEYERMSRRELSDKVKGLEQNLLDRGRAIFEEAAQLEEERAVPLAPSEQLLSRAADAEQSAGVATDPVTQRELRSKADYLRQQVREERRWARAVADVQGRWVDLHAEEAALRLVSERALARSTAIESESGGMDI